MIALALTTFAMSSLVLDVTSHSHSDCSGAIEVPRQTIRGGECFTPPGVFPDDYGVYRWFIFEGSCSDKIEIYTYTDANCTTREADDHGSAEPPGILDMSVSGPCKPFNEHSNYIHNCTDGSSGSGGSDGFGGSSGSSGSDTWWDDWGKYLSLALLAIAGTVLVASIVG